MPLANASGSEYSVWNELGILNILGPAGEIKLEIADYRSKGLDDTQIRQELNRKYGCE